MLARRVLTTLRRLELLRTGLVWSFVLPIWELLLIYFLTKSVVRKQKQKLEIRKGKLVWIWFDVIIVTMLCCVRAFLLDELLFGSFCTLTVATFTTSS